MLMRLFFAQLFASERKQIALMADEKSPVRISHRLFAKSRSEMEFVMRNKRIISFESDYTEGACEPILRKMLETNMEQLSGYGTDTYCEQAKKKIKAACECPDAEVFLLVGGTQTNAIVISSMLSQYEGVVTAKTGHINVHEAGAIEYTGHKVMEIDETEGKINANDLDSYMRNFYNDENHEHMVFPGMVYISYPTEYGTLYSKEELKNISEVCKKYNMPLYIDGARLGYGLMSKQSDITLPELATLCDVFYIGGTKVGALMGEAVVFTKNNTPLHFTTYIKQHSGLLAKGRILGIQFDTLFTDNLYFEISHHAIEMAEKIKKAFVEKNYELYIDSPTNQQFIILDKDKYDYLRNKVKFSFWEKLSDDRIVVRFATSWATKEEDVEELISIL